MNREIKFRAWDEERNTMYSGDEIEASEYLNAWLSYGELAIYRISHHGDYTELLPLQFTGLKDRNGAEIFEGDVIRVPDLYETPENTSTTYHNELVGFERCAFTLGGQPLTEDAEYISDECEVIGNIFANPELLEEIQA